MGSMRVLRLLLVGAAPAVATAAHAGVASRANPIRRVVTMLQKMQEKVTAEGKEEEKLFDKFMCYCSTGGGELAASIQAAEAKTAADASALEASLAQQKQLDEEIVAHKASRAEAEAALAEAKALREKEAAAFAKSSGEGTTNVAALGKAIDALERGAAGTGFLQTATAARLRQLSIDADLGAEDRETLTAFLAGGDAEGYSPQSGQITGILKQMKDTMEKDLAEITATEQAAVNDYDALTSAKTKEVEALGAAIESKTERSGRLGLEVVELQEGLGDTAKALEDDKKFLADLEKNCATKKQEWEERSKLRSEELLALAEVIKLLSDDSALELFKDALPSPALLQLRVSGKAVRQRALALLRAGRAAGSARDPRVDTVLLALAGKSVGFEEVLKKIDDMAALLGKEQADDDEKKAYCEKELDKAEDEKKVLDQTHADLVKSVADSQSNIASLTEEIAALIAGIQSLDKSVEEAMETRKAENAEYKQTMATDKKAKELLGVAKNRLLKFYNPALHKPEPKKAAPALAQIAAHGQEAPAASPETWEGSYEKKHEESNGVMAMMDMLIADLDKDMQEMEVNEKEAQSDYEKFLEDSKSKRAADSQLVADKEGNKAQLEAQLQKDGMEAKGVLREGMDKAEFLRDLHLECDWLLSNAEARKAAREGEIESLKKAKAVLAGADYALVQTRRSAHLRGVRQL